MSHKKVAKIIATAMVVNNLSSSVVLSKEVNLTKKNKENTIINESLKDNTRYSNIFKIEKSANSATKFLELINERSLEEIKLSSDINLSDVVSKKINFKNSNVVINGQGHSLYVPKLTSELKKGFITLQGDGIVLKNLNIVSYDEGKSLDKKESLVNITGDNTILEKVLIISRGGTTLNITDGKGISIRNSKIENLEKDSKALKVENAQVVLNNVDIKTTNGVGIEVLGKNSILNLSSKIKVDSPIEIRAQLRDGGRIKCDSNQLIHEKKIFGYTYFNVAKNSEKVKNGDEFLEAISNPIVETVKLMNNIDLRGYESNYYKVLKNKNKIDKNNYHITI